MAKRTADAVWEGTLRGGNGHMTFGGGAFDGQYSFSSRFEEGTGTNPEELIAAAHAGCFSMAFSADLERAGFPATSVRTRATVNFEKLDAGWTVTKIVLDTEGNVPGIDDEKFQEVARGASKGCPVSRLLAATPIEVNAKLVGS